VPHEVDAEESGAAGDEDLHGGKGQGSGVVENALYSTWNPRRMQGTASSSPGRGAGNGSNN